MEFGKTPPGSALDAESRLHDSAYAHYEDLGHRMAADAIYDSRVENLGGLGKFAGMAVLYGNQTLRAGMNLLEESKYGPIGLIVGALKNDYYLFDYMSNVDRYKKEVLAYYATDPGWEHMVTDAPVVEKYVNRRFATAGPETDSPKPGITPSVGGNVPLTSGQPYTTYSGKSRSFQTVNRPVNYNPYTEFQNYGLSGGRRRKRVHKHVKRK